ncbi:MAG: prolyl oligopeptidase family serine peptidase [Myxococcales bacterium]|nr:prolyl oligopeptidase family serine peptidase [Myxococcales bacterium]
MVSRLCFALFVLAFQVSCGDEERVVDPLYESAGPFAVGNATISMTDSARERTLSVEVWFPRAGDSQESGSVVDFIVDATNRASYEGLLAAADPSCPSTTTNSLSDATLETEAPLPLLVFSHCHNCVRFSSFAIAERLASHGFVVAAPDHRGNTVFDDLAGVGASLDSEFLQARAADISFAIDAMLAGDGGVQVDTERIAVYGHSFGAVTTGLVLQDDPRPIAGFAIASPMENPLLAGVEMDNIIDLVGFLVVVEDNSVTEIGSVFIRQNFEEAGTPAWKGEVADARHWSFSDICGAHSQFEVCCGTGLRQTDGEPFEHLPVSTGIAIAQAYVTAFFSAHLLDDGNARHYLSEERFSEQVFIAEHPGS